MMKGTLEIKIEGDTFELFCEVRDLLYEKVGHLSRDTIINTALKNELKRLKRK